MNFEHLPPHLPEQPPIERIEPQALPPMQMPSQEFQVGAFHVKDGKGHFAKHPKPLHHFHPHVHSLPPFIKPHAFAREMFPGLEDNVENQAREEYQAPKSEYNVPAYQPPPQPYQSSCGSNLLFGCAPHVQQVPCSAPYQAAPAYHPAAPAYHPAAPAYHPEPAYHQPAAYPSPAPVCFCSWMFNSQI